MFSENCVFDWIEEEKVGGTRSVPCSLLATTACKYLYDSMVQRATSGS
jgi:hypothetical protein